MGIWKLLSAVLFTIGLIIVLPYAYARAQLIPQLAPRSWITLGLTAAYLVVKLLIAEGASGEFAYHKYGHDFCILTVGAALTSLSLALMSNNDVFGTLPTSGLWRILDVVADHPQQKHVALFAGIFVLALVLTILTARISRATKEPDTKAKSLLGMINFLAGAAAFGLYVFTLVARGPS